jgi:hypothetical protein
MLPRVVAMVTFMVMVRRGRGSATMRADSAATPLGMASAQA